MRWLHWYPNRADVMGIVLALVLISICAFVLVGSSLQKATGFGPEWDCNSVPTGEPICMKRIGR
jgi:hypothetical protein